MNIIIIIVMVTMIIVAAVAGGPKQTLRLSAVCDAIFSTWCLRQRRRLLLRSVFDSIRFDGTYLCTNSAPNHISPRLPIIYIYGYMIVEQPSQRR